MYARNSMNQAQTKKMQQLSRLVLKDYKSIQKMDIELKAITTGITCKKG